MGAKGKILESAVDALGNKIGALGDYLKSSILELFIMVL